MNKSYFFEDLTEEECFKMYGFSKEDMRELYNNGEPLIKQRRKEE